MSDGFSEKSDCCVAAGPGGFETRPYIALCEMINNV